MNRPETPLTFEQSVRALSDANRAKWRLGVDRMEEFVRRAGLDSYVWGEERPKYVHVAGTNGKGSVTAFLQSLMVEHGFRTGSYFSPYVITVRERMQFGRHYIAADDFARLAGWLLEVAGTMADTELEEPSQFEIKTAMGFAHWMENDCDWVALEVGLGGRLDATNVVDPAACAIVSIGLDHTRILGETKELIAAEKAGIVKSGRPLIVGHVPGAPGDVIEKVAREVEAPFFRFGEDVVVRPDRAGWTVSNPYGSWSELQPSLFGAPQPHNMAVAISALAAAGAKLEIDAVRRGVARASVPGRFQRESVKGKAVILDGAHNEAACEQLVMSLHRAFGGEEHLEDWRTRDHNIVLLSGMLSGRSAADFYSPLAPIVREVHFGAVDDRRAVPPNELVEQAGHLFNRCYSHKDLDKAIDTAMAATGPNDTLLVAGSFHLVGYAAARLGLGDLDV